jgi:uncharacterized membrane protein
MSLLAGCIYLITLYIPDILVAQDPNWLLILFGITVLIGVIISGLSSALSVRYYLRLKAEDLYF